MSINLRINPFQNKEKDYLLTKRIPTFTLPALGRKFSATLKKGLVHWEDPEESVGEGGGRGDRDGEYL